MSAAENLKKLLDEIGNRARLVAVTKTHSPELIKPLIATGQLDLGENKVQEMLDKMPELSPEVKWHMIGHLQTNKVKFIAPFVHLIHSLDSLKLAAEISKHAQKNKRVIDCLLQIHVAEEPSKFGVGPEEVDKFLDEFQAKNFPGIRICGIMTMATFTDDTARVRKEFRLAKSIFDRLKNREADTLRMDILSMGMTQDYTLALEEGATMLRVGSKIFGARN
jgi:PLP dependent protein